MRFDLWKFVVASVLLLTGFGVQAQSADTTRDTTSAAPQAALHYAVLSLLGDQLSLVVYTGSTGTLLAPTRFETVPAVNTEFDDDALHGAADALAQSLPGTGAKLYTTNDAGLYRLQGKIFGKDDEARAARELVGTIVKDAPVDRIIVLTKFRSSAELKLPTLNLTTGAGELEGIGYYVDEFKRTRDEFGARGKGFLASYCYVKATMLDAKTLAVVGEAVGIDSESKVNVRDSLHAWNILTEEQKEASLRRTVQSASHDTVQKLLRVTQAVATVP